MEERNVCLDIQWKRGMNDRILHTKRGMNDWILSALHDSNVFLDTVQSVHRKCGCCNLYCIVYTVCVSSSKCLLKGSQQFLDFSKEWAPNFMRQPWQNIFQNCHLQLSAWAAFLNSRKGGRGHRAPLLLSPPPLPLPPFPAPPLFPPSPLNSDLTTVVECNLLLQKPSPPLRMDLFSGHGEGIIWISTIMIGNRNG